MQTILQDFVTFIGNISSVTPESTTAFLETTRKYYQDLTDPQMLGFALYKTAEQIMRSKAVPQGTLQFFQQCVYDIIDQTVKSEFRSGTEALRYVFDVNMEFYKHNNLDPTLKYPLGLYRKLNYYQPEVGEEIDVVKPYVTSTSYCGWTRGVLISKDKKYTVLYANTESSSICKDMPFFDKLGSRTQDYQWRMNLNIGDKIDALNRVWFPSTITEIGVQNGSKRARVSYRRFCEDGNKVDVDGNRYIGLGPNEDEWIDLLSCRIQKPNKMARQYCQYSHTSEEILTDDYYDLIFEKQNQEQTIEAIMRCNYTRSLSFLHFYDKFAQLKGNELFLQMLKKRQLNIDYYINVMIVIGNTSFLVPRMSVNRFLPLHLEEGIIYLKENCKNFNLMRLDAISYFIESCCRRLYSLTRKHMIISDIKRFMCLQYLKLNLEKQMIALKYISELIRPLRPYQPSEKQQLNVFLKDNQIFYRIIQANAHEQILSRSADTLRYMIEVNIIGWPQIQHIWNIFPHSDLRGRTTIEKLIGDISKDFTFEYTSKIIDKILTLKETDITIDKLNLLRTLKDKDLNKEYKVKILNYLWQCLTIKSTNIKQNVEEQIENVFRGFISTIKQNALRLEVLKAIIQRLREINTVRTEMYLFKEFILTYQTKNDAVVEGQIEENYPKTITDVVNYLKNQHIYEIILRLLGQNKAKDKIESMLEFLQFLFQKDNDDISQTVKAIYDILGPSDVFLLWAKNITKRAIHFFINMYQNTQDMSKFQKISTQGLQAIKTILLDINVSAGNMKVVTRRKIVQQFQGPLLPGATSVATDTQDYSLMKDKNKPKEQIITFIYVLKSPFECIGLTFLLRFLQVINSSSVYNDIVKLIIQFIENLDESIIHKTEQFRKQFLSDMFVKINELANKTELDPSTKAQLDIYVNLIQQLFAQTQKSGLQLIKPHFSTIQGENIRLKIENIMTGNELYKKQPYIVEINENATLWDLKIKLSPIYSEPADKIDVIKYVNPIEETSFSKSLSDLHFFNEEGIKISRRDPKEIPKHDLVSIDGTALHPKLEKIVQKWFFEYKNSQELLGFEQLKKLAIEKWKGSIMKDQAKLEQVIAKYDKQNKKGINLDQFKDFFWRKSIENSTLVWRLINLSGHLNNLRHKNDPVPEVSISTLPRKILSTRVVYDTIFKILANPIFQPVHISYYKLLTLLETDHDLCLVVKSNIKEFLETEKCLYRLSYGLQSLTNELENSLQFYGQFFEHDGHQQIANKLEFFFQEDKSLYTFETSLKTIVIPNLLRILNLYIYPWHSHKKMARFYKKIKINHFDLNDIIQKLQKQEYFSDENSEKRQILQNKGKSINSEQIYRLSFAILQNLTKNFTNQYLVKICNETIRLLAYLSCADGLFQPQTILNCANSGSLNIRRASHSLIYIYLLEHPQERFSLLEKMVSNIPPQTKLSTNSYFEILKIAVEKSIEFSPDSQETTQFFTNLSLQLIKLFLSSPSEPRSTFSVSKNIEGILSNLLVIIQKKTNICRFLKHFKEELILKGLFFYKAKDKLSSAQITPQMLLSQYQPEIFENYPKCKSDVTRKILMEIIYTLYKESDGQRDYFFSQFILPILSQLPDNTKKAFPRSLHVGLNNLGSTCYMNSMLQVLNSIGAFRNALMMTNINAPMVHQLKSLFSFLFFSERLDYIPKGLLNSFTPPINPGIQQDTTQFLNFLFDQLEHLLKQSPYKNLLEELFKGSQVAQMICHSCGAKRERIETFFSYSVQIQGKYDLQTALDGMHAGQLISDCLCESCGNRSDTTKRNVLNQVPNIFFVHLKRIVFDYNMFMNTKIHTRLVFPEELNFQPFTKEGLQLRESLGIQYMKSLGNNEEEQKKFEELTLHAKSKDYYKLKLKGIIVHSGTADVGHYYTILKKDNGWVKFDDSRVTSFPQMMFDDQCFGGAWVADEWGGSASSKNAYVLIYEKQFKKDIQIEQIKENGMIQKKNVPEKEFKTFNTIDWYREVWLDNHLLMLEQHLTGQNFTKQFMSFIGKMLEISPSEATVSIISQIFYKISALSGEVGNLLDIFLKNQHLVNMSILDNYVLLDSKRTFGMLFHQQQKVREFASVYLQRVLMICYEKQGDQAKQKVVRFIQEYINNLQGEVAKNWLRIDGYFKFFDRIIESSLAFHQLYGMFVSFDLVAYFIDFILEKQSPLNVYAKKYSLGTKSNPVNFSSGISIILSLFKHSYGLIGKNTQVPSIREDRLFHLSDNAVLCLCNMGFYEKMIKQNQNPQALAGLIQRMSILNPAFSHSIARVLLKIFNENTDVSDQCNTVMLCISRFMTISDDFWTQRAEFILGFPSSYIYQKNIMNSIDEEKYTYPSTLENVFPLQSLISYAYMNKLRVPLTVLNMIVTILESTSCNSVAMDYIIKIPAPTYTYLRYIDWMRSFVNQVINHLNLQQKKKEEAISKISLCNLYLDDLYKRINSLNLQMQTEILGRVEQKIMIDSYNDPNNWVQVNLYRVPVHGLISLPSDKGNVAFGQILTNGRLETLVTQNSNILNFFKQLTKPLAIKAKNVEEHEDKDIISLFDEDPDPKKQGTEVKKQQVTKQNKPQQKMVEQQKIQQKVKIPSQPLEVIEEIIPVQANVSEAKLLDDYLYCLEVLNNTDVNKIVVVNYRSFDNALIPSSLRIMSSRNKEEFWFHKVNPDLPLGKVDCTFVVEDYIQPTRLFFRLYGSVYTQVPSVPQPEQPKKAEQKMDIEPIKDFNPQDMQAQDYMNDDQISCPHCTLFNPSTNTECQICGGSLS